MRRGGCGASHRLRCQSAQLKQIRRPIRTGRAHSFTAQQQTLRRLDAVLGAFFDGAGGAEGRGKTSRGTRGSSRTSGSARSCSSTGTERSGFRPAGAGGRGRRPAVGSVKVRQHRQVTGTVKALQLTREHRRWYVIVTAEADPVPLPAAGRAVGVDVGVARFLTTSDGEVVANPRFLAASAEVIADLQRRKSRAKPGSGNRKRRRRALAKDWRKIRNRRRHFPRRPARWTPATSHER